MSAAWLWARAQLRHRLLAVCAIGLLAGLAGATTLTAVSGARRTASVYDRHVGAVDAPDAWIEPDYDPSLWAPGVLDPFLELDGVESSSELATFMLRPEGSDIVPLSEFSVVGAVDDQFGVEQNRLRIVDGRLYDPASEDEIVLTEEYAEATGLTVGDTLTFESWSPGAPARAFERNFDFGDPDGPAVDLTVVGIAREIQELPVNSDPTGSAYTTAAFTRRWRGELAEFAPMGLVYLSKGADGYDGYRDEVLALAEQSDVSMLTMQPTVDTAQVAGAIDAQVLALLILAGVTAVAGVVVLYAAFARVASFAAADQEALRAVGLTARERLAGVVLLGLPAAVVAVVLSVGLAVLGSSLLPVGTPGRIEPNPGASADYLVLVLGGVGVLVVLIAVAAAAGRSVVRAGVEQRSLLASPGIGAAIGRRLSGSAPGTLGVAHAFDLDRGGQAGLARSTLVGCTVGVMGIAAALTFAGSLSHLGSTPRLYGDAADFYVGTIGEVEDWQALATSLEGEPEISGLATVISTSLVVNDESVGVALFDLRRGDPVSAIVSGRAPQSRDEMTVGADLADQLGIGVGDEVSVTMADGSPSTYTVVGINALPNGMGGYSIGAAVIGDSLDRFLTYDEGPWYGIAVNVADGVDEEEYMAALSERDDVALVDDLEGARPKAVSNLEEVSVFPVTLALLLGLLAATFLLHALTTGARRRAQEVAVLKAVGFTRAQLRRMVIAQALVIAVVSVVIGVPLGVGIGRIAWAVSVRDLGLVVEHHLSAFAATWLALVVLIAVVFGLVASRRVTRVKPAVELRAGHME